MVEFKLTKEQLLAKELFRSFAENEIKPISRDMDEAEKFDMDLLDKMKKYGLMGIPYSKEYGGEGADVLTYALFPQVATDFFKYRDAQQTKVDAKVADTEDGAYPV